MLSLALLGSFLGSVDGRPLQSFRSNRSQALLMYLATESALGATFHQRESLMNLLWPGLPLKSAQVNLRQTLYQLRQAIAAAPSPESEKEVEFLLTDRRTVQVNPKYPLDLDVAQFVQGLNGGQRQWPEAVALYRGDFLADFYLPDANPFEEWVTARRAGFQRQMLDALASLAEVRIEEGRYEEAEGYARRQLELDPLREKGHRQLMTLLARDGRRSEALAQYEACRQLLESELGVEPSTRTRDLQAAILAGEVEETAGTIFEHLRGYELKESLGSGMFGVVYRAVQPSVGREVAIKSILPRYANDPAFIRRFEAEAFHIAQMEHPFIVPLYDYWREPDNAYLVMRYLKGGSLLSALRSGPWNLGPAVKMLDQVCSALSAAHQQGVVHRDIKPANILLDESGNAYLADFGIAKDLGETGQLTATGVVIGTPAYLSPEQILSDSVSPQTDIYSLGVVLYEVLTGEKPFADDSIGNLINKHLNEPVPMVSHSRPDLGVDGVNLSVDAVIQRAMAKRAAERYSDALEMAEAFRSAIRGADEAITVAFPDSIPAVQLYNPYKGLRAFQEADSDDFFGREALVEQLVGRLADSRFLAVVGPSGSGKSSAVKAGLIPALRRGAIAPQDNAAGSEKWFVAEMVPGSHPLEELELGLWPIAVDPPSSLVDPMERDIRGLLRTIRRILPSEDGAQLLLVIDQFEELFTLVDDVERRAFFIDSLLAALRAPRSPLRVIVTLRADFYDRPLQVQSLGKLLKENTEVVLPLTAEELAWAIREPAQRVGVRLEPGLAEVIVADVSDQPGGLPLLQFALTEMFEQRQDNQMTRESYQEIGGVTGALGRRADEIYQGLDEAGQEATRQLFMRLVTLGEGVEDTRRRVLRSELEAIGTEQLIINGERLTVNHPEAGGDAPEEPSLTIKNSQFTINYSSVIDQFGAARLLTFDHDALTREPTVELAHEALLREWGQLRDWLDESRDDVRSQRFLAQAAGEWLAAGKEDSYLLRGGRLSQLEGWAENSSVALTQDESGFLAASLAAREARRAEEEERRQRELETAQRLAETEKARAETEAKRAEEQTDAARRLRQRAFLLAGVVVIAVILAIAAIVFGRNANNNAKAAQSRELAASSFLSQETDPELSLLLAVEALSTAETGEAEQALHAALLASRVRQRLVGHQAAIQRVAYSPDGQYIALYAAGEDLATIWDAESGQLLHEIPTDRCCWGLYFDDAGRRLALAEGGAYFGLAIWDVASGEKLESFPLPIPNFEIVRYYLNPDWARAAIFFADETLSVWDIEEGTKLFDLPGHRGLVEMEYSKDGSRLVSYDSNGLVLVWDADTGELVKRLETGEFINDHAVSPDGRRVALAVDKGFGGGWVVQVWDVDAPPGGEGVSPIETSTGHPAVIRLIDFSADGRMVASASGDGTSRIWDTATGEELLVLPHGVHVRSVVFHPDGHSLLSSDLEGVARVWDIRPEGASERLSFVANLGPSFGADLSPDGSTLATGGIARLWDLATGALHQSLVGHRDLVSDVDFHPDGGRVATASLDGTARIWDTATGEQLLVIDGHGGAMHEFSLPGVSGVDYHPDGERLATAGADGTARIWDSRSGEELMVLVGHTASLSSIAFSPDGNYLATGQRSETNLNVEDFPTTVWIWDAETGQGLFSFDSGHGENVWGLAFSPDGRFLVTAGSDATVRLWALDFDAGHAELIETLTGHTNWVFSARFSPDGRLLATATAEEVRLWDLMPLVDGADRSSVVELFVLPGGYALAFTPDGSELISGGRDGLIHVYLLDKTKLMELAESRLTRTLTEAECRQYLHKDVCPEPVP